MYLKSLELIGFKSFAERTKLEFEPGMTAIVGPNGCGKSNISDAVRWVLGEQSAKALRGAKMEDCIFNGTDSHKPLGMAEVTLTLADCEKSLGTEFHEVNVTRRVFRTGEGQYFVNKTPCRLKDIQRLFMDTGIGTNSYSLMEQGRIDLILSSRPEDRREVFEEASGITKFKADKKEAIRKLEHTEANLLRLADIIREVRRQIISLQRQAGKARRYKTLQEQLRGFDLYATRERLNALSQEIASLEARLASVSEREEALRADLSESDRQAGQIRSELGSTEREIAEAMEAAVRAKNELDRARELIRVNQDRIREFRDFSDRDNRDAEEARARLAEHKASLQDLLAKLEEATRDRDAAERELRERAEQLAKHDAGIEDLKKAQHDLNAESVDLESRLSRLQNELYSLEAQERTNVIRRERLAAEQAELQRTAEAYQGRQDEMAQGLKALQADVDGLTERIAAMTGQRSNKAQAIEDLRKDLAEIKTRLAARQAQAELLGSPDAKAEGFPGGARLLLDPSGGLAIDRSRILGSLAELVQAEPAYRTALEASLRAWLDAVVVSDDVFALELLKELQARAGGSARTLAVTSAAPARATLSEGPGERLADHVRCSAEVRPLVERLLHEVRVVDDLSSIRLPLPAEAVFVTRTGAVARGSGSFEFWMPEPHEVNPLARQHLLAEWAQEAADLARRRDERETALRALLSDEQAFDESLRQAQAQLDEGRRKLALREGENHIISEEASQARERADTVAWELNLLNEQQSTGGGRRTEIHREMEEVRTRLADIHSATALKADALRALEHERSERNAEVTDRRIRFAERRQEVEHLAARKDPVEARIVEFDSLIRSRSEGVTSYRLRITELEQAIREAEGRIQPLQEEAAAHGTRLEEARRRREEKMSALALHDQALREKRGVMDEVLAQKSQVDVELAEQRIRRQNLIERVGADYHVTPEQMAAEPEPAWENGAKPDRETLETQIAELRAKLEAMGPVNLVAIEEHRELEERFTFLSQQQEDLVKAKQQLMDMIRRINKTTTEMFQATFDQVNANFQDMFKKLFGGGSAKLVLVNEEDVLESGIEIIARPPGKKLQTVSLLSGGERTMTAVALLFSLYMVKPSPFCLLDELDAALDESNIGRFIKVVQGFLSNSQFVVITHNRQTISAADVLYGVTMEQNGVSKIVSVKFSRHAEKPAGAAEPVPALEPGPEPAPAPVASQDTPSAPARGEAAPASE